MAPKWFTLLNDVINKHPEVKTFPCASVEPQSGQPRVRFVAFRSFMHEETSRPLLLISTDSRMPKVSHFTSGAHEPGKAPSSEIAWWFEEAGEQFRITSNTYILPNQIAFPELAKKFPYERLRGDKGSSFAGAEAWWEQLRLDYFDHKHGRALRASFARPAISGAPLEGGYDAAKAWTDALPSRADAKDEKEREEVERALENFSLVVFEPVKVERLELSTTPHRRTAWIWQEDQSGAGAASTSGSWEEKILVP